MIHLERKRIFFLLLKLYNISRVEDHIRIAEQIN